jgi:hypothetical protein
MYSELLPVRERNAKSRRVFVLLPAANSRTEQGERHHRAVICEDHRATTRSGATIISEPRSLVSLRLTMHGQNAPPLTHGAVNDLK